MAAGEAAASNTRPTSWAAIGSLSKQGWNVFGGFTYTKQEALKATDSRLHRRPASFLDKGLAKTSGTSFPGNYSQSSTGCRHEPVVAELQPDDVRSAYPTVFGPNSCRYDYTQAIDLIGEQEQWSFYGRGTLQLGAHNQLFLEYFTANNKLSTNVAPTPLTGLSMTEHEPVLPGQRRDTHHQPCD